MTKAIRTAYAHTPLEADEQQRDNLRKLAKGLKNGIPGKFNMNHYYVQNGAFSEGGVNQHSYDCGTSACAVGWGPYILGIPKTRYWHDYVQTHLCKPGSVSFDWMFHMGWSKTANTPKDASARILYALKHGIPSNYNGQMTRQAPLSF